MKRPLFALLCLALATVCIADRLVAAPMYGTPWTLKQPGGGTVDVRIWGDEYYQVVESLDGFTLMRDPVTSVIVYAKLSPDGNELVSTGVRVGTRSPATLGLSPHVRIDPGVAEAQAAQMRAQAFPTVSNLTYGTMPPQAPPSTGNVKGLVLLADFSDMNASIAQSEVVNFCNQVGYSSNGNNGSVHDYFNEVSNGVLNYTLDVNASYHRASQPFSYYDDCSVTWLQRAEELITEILNQMEADGFDFSGYDANGDGDIDAINLFYAGSTGCGWAKGMWPGAGSLNTPIALDGKTARRYQITGMGASLGIGTFCHENGHMICFFPDLYDYDGDSAGVGNYDIMCVSGGDNNHNPLEPSAWCKIKAGWESVTALTTTATGIALPVSSGNTCYKWAKNATEYYLIENRQASDRDATISDTGLALWLVDEGPKGDHSWQQRLPNKHYLVTLVQADGDWDLEANNNSGDSGDLYAAPTEKSATDCTTPNTHWWDGTNSGLALTNISTSSANMTFDFSPNDDDPVAQVKNFSLDGNQYCCIKVKVSDINDGSYDPDGPGDIKSLCITSVDGVAQNCVQEVTVCGDGEHTVRLTITDLCDNTDYADATVEVINSAPVAVKKDYSANADDNCCIVVHLSDIDGGTYDPDGADDIKSFCITDLDGDPVSCADSVTVCGEGLHYATITVTDWCDSTTSAVAEVKVIDITPPTISVDMDRNVLWPPNHKLVTCCAEIVAADNCDPDPEVLLVDVWSDEPDNDKGDGNTVDDIQGEDKGTLDYCFDLRAERIGLENGRCYTIVYSAEDNSGNIAYDTTCVKVPHDQSAGAACATGFAPSGTTLNSNVSSFALVITGTPAINVLNVDMHHVYVGNTAAIIRAGDTRLVDTNHDGRLDLAAVFTSLDAGILSVIQGPEDLATFSVEDGEIDAQVINDGPIGLHFAMKNGTNYLVSNIYALGEPVVLPNVNGKTVIDPRALPVTPPQSVQEPKVTALSSIHPNPFNPQTTVDFTLASSARVRIAIYDVKGSLVRLVVDETMAAGAHSTRWNGVDQQGRQAASGIYFVRMIAGSYSEVRKIVMLK